MNLLLSFPPPLTLLLLLTLPYVVLLVYLDDEVLLPSTLDFFDNSPLPNKAPRSNCPPCFLSLDANDSLLLLEAAAGFLDCSNAALIDDLLAANLASLAAATTSPDVYLCCFATFDLMDFATLLYSMLGCYVYI